MRWRKQALPLLALDLALVLLAWWLAFWLRFNLDVPPEFAALAWRSGLWTLPSFAFALQVAGWLITAGTTLFGAPFWFDLLQRAVQLRGTGAKPQAAPANVKDNTAASMP